MVEFVPTSQVRTYGPGAAAPIPFRATGVEFVKVGPSRSLSADIHLNMCSITDMIVCIFSTFSGDGRVMPDPPAAKVNCEDLGEVVSVTAGADAIVHMAAYPSPGPVTENIVFRTNTMDNWNVLEAAEINGIRKIVMASSINALGAAHQIP